MKYKKLQAIYDEDLAHILEKFGQLEKINKGEVFCILCHSLITLENIQLIIPRSNKEFDYICNDVFCVEAYYKNLESKE